MNFFAHFSSYTGYAHQFDKFMHKRHNEFLIVPQLVEKAIFDFYASCGSTHSIEFALQIHKFREHGPGHPLLPLCGNSPCVSGNLYKGRKNVSAGRGFSSRFARKRGFEREAVRKTKFFDSLKSLSQSRKGFSFYFVRYSSINSHASSMQPGQERRTVPSATPLRSRHRYAPFFCSNFSLSIFVTL